MHIELRSDTFTKPTPAMREAIANAEVGDDMAGEDPTVNRLESRMAEMLGKEAAVFNCSGTQSNQMAIWAHCQPGDEVLLAEAAHIMHYEAGAPAVLSGVTLRPLASDAGRLDVEHLEGMVRSTDQHFAQTRLVCLENSTNRGGGTTYPLEQVERVGAWAHDRDLRVHMDGARLFNAATARGYDVADVAAHLDSVSICFSKGLGCPMGSILVGDAPVIARARRARKLFGGALRQAGIVAAAAEYANDHHIDRLTDDHAHARRLAERIEDIDALHVNLQTVETNLFFIDVDPTWGSGAEASGTLAAAGVHLYDIGPQRLRAVTHLDVSADEIDTAIDVFRDCFAKAPDASVAAMSY